MPTPARAKPDSDRAGVENHPNGKGNRDRCICNRHGRHCCSFYRADPEDRPCHRQFIPVRQLKERFFNRSLKWDWISPLWM